MEWLLLARAELTAHPLLAAIPALALVAIIERLRPGTFVRRLWLAIPFVAYGGLVAAAVAVGAYSDHIEPAIVSGGAALARGDVLYGDPLRALPYGPAAYMATGLWSTLFGATVESMGLVAVFAALAGVGVVVLIQRRRGERWPAAVGVLLVLYLAFGAASLWIRAEPFLLLCVPLAIGGIGMASLAGAVLAGAAAGVVLNLKLSAALCLLPIAAYALHQRHRAWLLTAMLTAVAVGLVPFVHPLVSLSGYIDVLAVTSTHDIVPRRLVTQVQWALLLLMVAGPTFQRRAWREGAAVDAALVAAIAGTAVVAAKIGAGAYHFLPFAPIIAARAIAPGTRRVTMRDVAIVTIGLVAVVQTAYTARFGWSPIDRAAEADVRAITADDGRDIAIGYSDHYRGLFARPVAIERGSPYLFDAATLMDRQAAGLPFPATLVDEIGRCPVDRWALPGGDPFGLRNAYSGQRLFPEAFTQAFRASYVRTGTGGMFDIWVCRSRVVEPAR